MRYLTIYPTSIDTRAIDTAARALADGKAIVFPTDTVYAVGCDALNSRAIERLCAYKGINPSRQQLSVVCSEMSQAAAYARIDNRAFALLRAHLPGPFTFILPASPRLPKAFKGRHTVGVRIPDNTISRALAQALGHPLLSTSVPIDPDDPEQSTEPRALETRLANAADIIIDGGPGGTELSTVVDLTDSSSPMVVREGKGVFEP